MDDVAIARAIHVAAIVVWIGGMAMVTTVLLPAVSLLQPEEGLARFAAIERRFAWQARAATLLAGATGVYMVAQENLWSSFFEPRFW